jgi:hypothetical protein
VFRTVFVLAAMATTAVVALPSAGAAPETDDAGYLNSTARCAPPATAVMFGATADSRIAICKLEDGSFEYRGVRISDGAKLIAPAKETTNGYIAASDGIEYLVTAKSLVVSEGNDVLREEPMVEIHGAGASESEETTPTSPTELPPPLPAERPAEEPGQPAA